jgi:hypothetical protein
MTMPNPPEHKLRWYQYKLSSLFVLMTLVALASGWYQYKLSSLFILMTLVALACSWYAAKMLEAGYSHDRKNNTFSLSIETTDGGLVHLKDLTNLKEIGLDDTQITDEELVHLEGLTKLEELYLGWTQITDAGLEHLKGLTKLKVLHLKGTQVTDEGVKKLREALPNCTISHGSLP